MASPAPVPEPRSSEATIREFHRHLGIAYAAAIDMETIGEIATLPAEERELWRKLVEHMHGCAIALELFGRASGVVSPKMSRKTIRRARLEDD